MALSYLFFPCVGSPRAPVRNAIAVMRTAASGRRCRDLELRYGGKENRITLRLR